MQSSNTEANLTKGDAGGDNSNNEGKEVRERDVESATVFSSTSTESSSRWNTIWNASWVLPSLLVFYSVLKELKVGEPFMFKYQTDTLGYNASTLNGEIYPYGAYSYVVAIVPIFLFTDVLLYKPTMYVEVLGQLAYRYTLVFTNNVLSQQIGQTMYGIAQAAEVAFYSYIYGKVRKDQYKQLTSWTRAGTMAGRTGGYIFAQIALLTGVASYLTLNTIAFYVPCVALIVCFLMPRVQWQNLVERMREQHSERVRKSSRPSAIPVPTYPSSYAGYAMHRLSKLKSDFLKIYSNGYIRKWSFWWAMTTCLALQVGQYTQTLFGEVQHGDNRPLNGFADAGYTFTATVCILLMNSLPINWDKWGELALVLISAADALLLFIYSKSLSIYPMYGCYIAYRSSYQVMISIAQWNIAKKMVCDSFGLAFGVNSFVALILQSVLTRTVVDRRGLGMQVRDAFLVYSGLHTLVALIFLGSILYGFIASKKQDKVQPRSRKSTIASQRRAVQFSPQISVVSSKTARDRDVAELQNISDLPLPVPEPSDVASELDFDSDEDDFEDEEEVLPMERSTINGMFGESLAASFSASFASTRRG